MVSRKKAAAKARKAAKAKAREEQAKERTTAQMQQVKVSCKHGAEPLSLKRNSIVFQFVRAFAIKVDEAEDDSNVARCLVNAHSATLDEFADVWKDVDTIKMAMSFILAAGTEELLECKFANARKAATYARYLEQYIAVVLNHTQATVNWPKILETHEADGHTLVKFFRHRIPCSCLDEHYDKVKSITKMGFCYSPQCSMTGKGVERSKTKYCSRCRCATYCSRECQIADWSKHKSACDNNAAIIAKFQAKQHIQA